MATYTSYTTRKPDTNVITIAPNIADIDLADTYQQLVDTQNTTLGSTLTPDIMPASELQAAMDYRNAFKQGDTVTAVNNFYKLITPYINQPDFSLDTVLFWYYKLKYSNKEITAYQNQASFYNQNILTNQIFGASLFANNVVTNNNTSDNYFNIVSDSIGCIVNSKFIQLDSTLPLFDVSQQYYGTPIPIAASTDSKISANTRNVMYNLSQKTTMYMKRNLLNIGYTNLTLQENLAADATTSHGLNLINDLPTFVNINKMLDQFKSALSTVFSQAKAFSFVQYLNNVGNTTALNLRDIFPVATSDRDFLVVTSEQAAQASVAEAQQEQSDANAAAALAQQQQSFVIKSSPTTSGTLQTTQRVDVTGSVSQDGLARSSNNISVDFDGPTNPYRGQDGEGIRTRSGLDSNTSVGVITTEGTRKLQYDIIINNANGTTTVIPGVPSIDTNPSHGIGNPAPTVQPGYKSAGIPIELTAATFNTSQFKAAGIALDGNSVKLPPGVSITVRPTGASSAAITTASTPVPGIGGV